MGSEKENGAKDWILKHVKPTGGRRLAVEILGTTMDFAMRFADLGTSFSGISITDATPTAHAWRFVSRRTLLDHAGASSWEVQNTNSAWDNCLEHEDDVVFLGKSSISSRYLSQQPLLVLPQEFASVVDKTKLAIKPLNGMDARAEKDCFEPFISL